MPSLLDHWLWGKPAAGLKDPWAAHWGGSSGEELRPSPTASAEWAGAALRDALGGENPSFRMTAAAGRPQPSFLNTD